MCIRDRANADLTANINAKFEQITANAEINIAELKSNIEAQRVSLTAVSYTHLLQKFCKRLLLLLDNYRNK